MYFVYLIKSCNSNWCYVGLTENVDRRLMEHNRGYTSSTKNRKPYKLLFKKKFLNRSEARDFEKYLKIRSNKEKLIRSLSNS